MGGGSRSNIRGTYKNKTNNKKRRFVVTFIFLFFVLFVVVVVVVKQPNSQHPLSLSSFIGRSETDSEACTDISFNDKFSRPGPVRLRERENH